VSVHADTHSAEGHALGFKADALLKSRGSGLAYAAPGAHNAVPRQTSRRAQRPYHLPGSPGISGRACDLPVRGDFPSRYLPDDSLQCREHE